MKRRCFAHDYKGRSIYLITLEVSGRRRLLGRIRGADAPGTIPLSVSDLNETELTAVNAALFEPSALGRRVAEEFMKIGEHVAGVKPLLAQAMPDHFHGILFVTRQITRPLGSIMAGFKGRCSQLARDIIPSLWEPGFHDRILTSEGQLDKMFRYVRDNPRRSALRSSYRDLFTSVRCLAGNGHSFDAFGNVFLLQRDTLTRIQCSRSFFGFKREKKQGLAPNNAELKIARDPRGVPIIAFETAEFAAEKTALLSEAAKGSVLVSPCISDGEKAIAYAAVDAGYPLIVLRSNPFPPRFKPSGRFFDACANGKLLILYPQELHAGEQKSSSLERRITRSECLMLNSLAADICRRS